MIGLCSLLSSDTSPPGVPTITSVTPSEGPEAGSTALTIVGTHLLGATSVRLHAVITTPTNVDSVVIVDDNTITCVTRAWDPFGPSTLKLFITTPGGLATKDAAYTFNHPPIITSASRAIGDTLGGGTPYVLTGTDFGSATAVNFGVVGAAFVINSPTQITVASPPAHAAGTFNVTVVGPGGTSNGFAFKAWDPSVPIVPTLMLEAPSYSIPGGTGTFVPRFHWQAQDYVEATNPPANSPAGTPTFTRAGLSSLHDGDSWANLIDVSHTVGATIAAVFTVTNLPGAGGYDFLVADDTGGGNGFAAIEWGSDGTLYFYYYDGATHYATLGAGTITPGRHVIIAERVPNGASSLLKIRIDGGAWSSTVAAGDLANSGTVYLGRAPTIGGGIYRLESAVAVVLTAKSNWSDADAATFDAWAGAMHP